MEVGAHVPLSVLPRAWLGRAKNVVGSGHPTTRGLGLSDSAGSSGSSSLEKGDRVHFPQCHHSTQVVGAPLLLASKAASCSPAALRGFSALFQAGGEPNTPRAGTAAEAGAWDAPLARPGTGVAVKDHGRHCGLNSSFETTGLALP